ncbi:glycosyl hydrolase, partial [Methylobacterium nigriterrae]|uniref:glycosyl hydrolase n=1 Tax=Methylobacterium nigriterrae TaxID=3127512 RepID=UPI0030136C7D
MTALSVYVGNDPAALAAYQAWLGRPVDDVLFYLNNDSWAAFDSSVPWAVGLWAPSQTSVIWSVPLTVWGTALDEVATGAYDAHFLKAAQALAAGRSEAGPIYVRLGWEFNGSWMPWAAQGHEAAFVTAFQNVVSLFRSVSDQFRFVWDVNAGGSYDPAKAYPGDAYVDVVGMDFYYNTAWDPTDPLKAFASKVSQSYGLQWQQDFAAAHGKATAISEWGVQTDGAGAYIAAAAKWFADHG